MDVFGNALWGGNGTPICRAHSDQQSPKIVSDGNGGIIVAWVEDRLSMMNPDIYAQRISAEGDTLWEDNGTIIANADYDQNYIKMVSDNHGGAIIVWEDGRGSDGDIYAQRVNGNGVCLWTANGTLISLVDDEDYYPNVFVNQKDDIFVAWDKYDDDYYYVSAQKMNLNGACQWDLGGVKVKQTEVYAIEDIPPLIIDDMAGGIILGWGEYDWDESDYFNYVNHISATGVRLWGSQGVLLSPDGDYETFDIISDGSGGLFATYDFEGDQYVQHIAATGFDDWETHVQISSGGSVAWHSPIVSDLNGGVIIAWSQNVEGVGSRRIFAQKINATGDKQWHPEASELCNITAHDRYIYGAVSDTVGGAIIAFYDFRNGNTDIYAQRIKEFTSPLAPILTVNTASTPNGAITLDWNDVIDADNYTVYRSTQPIVAITGGLTAIANGITASTCGDTLSAYGTYYYAVVTRNSEGNSALSNSQKVTYPDPNTADEKPDDGTVPTEPEPFSPLGVIIGLVLGLVSLGVIGGYVFIKNRSANDKYLQLLKR